MAYEYPTMAGVVRLFRIQQNWVMRFNGRQRGRWHSPDVAVVAIAQHQSGLSEWDRVRVAVPDDLLDWRPLGESL